MTTFLLIRHGVNDFVGKRLAGCLPGVHLNATGREQAEKVAQALLKAPIKAIYSSPLERAMETAAPLAQALSLEVQVQPGLKEIDFGQWQGKTVKQLSRLKLWKVVQQTPSLMRFPGGETFTEAQQRLVETIAALAARHTENEMVACFSHCDAIRLVLTHYLGMPLDSFQRLGIETASISVLHLGEHGPHLGPIDYRVGLSFEPPPGPHPEKGKNKES